MAYSPVSVAGTKKWLNDVIFVCINKKWLKNGVLHRTDGPAIERDGYKAWFLNGVRHRTDGPAVEYINGSKAWYLNGTELSEDLFLKVTKGPVKRLPLYLGMGFDRFISERLQHESGYGCKWK